jgi:hypothetical protein
VEALSLNMDSSICDDNRLEVLQADTVPGLSVSWPSFWLVQDNVFVMSNPSKGNMVLQQDLK